MEKIKKSRFTALLRSFDFRTLFNELGWDHFSNELPIGVQETTIVLQGLAQKKGFAILLCEPLPDGSLPRRSFRLQLEKKTAKLYHEHLIIYTDSKKSLQVWQLAVKEENKPRQVKDVTWYIHQDAEILFQRLRNLLFTLNDEDTISIVDVTQRVSENFAINTEKVTKKFYTEFKKQHGALLKFIEGIDDHIEASENTNKQWYASLMLNRLMFCYFIQKKGFLDQDIHYLRNKLKLSKKQSGIDNFYNFYKNFLMELFHDGLGKPKSQRHHRLQIPLGKIPYLNGGLFDVHELEHAFESISINDDAFQDIFVFFDNWNWHLDSRYQATGRDINPDVIGYIFEKYINDRAAMGAYYTKEDITDYIGKNTIIPFLIDETERCFEKAPSPTKGIWQFLKQSGSTYIYDVMKHGVPPQDQDIYSDLPDDILSGIELDIEDQVVTESTALRLWDLREPWNQKAPSEIALPSETYRELIERRQRYSEILEYVQSGDINSINSFITYNLDIRQFIQDYLEATEDAEFIQNFFISLKNITILDPTVGSGASLFAALNILEPLYEVCLERMDQFVIEEPGKYLDIERTLEKIRGTQHPNRSYFIYKTIILNNLYGVDIMREAVEIAKLRLFLKLVASVNVKPQLENYGLEPLPDIDFNIRAGNTLIGFANESEIIKSIEKKEGLFSQKQLDEFNKEFKQTSEAYLSFQEIQLSKDQGSEKFRASKVELNKKLFNLNHKLNVYMAEGYGISDPNKKVEIESITGNKESTRKTVNQYTYWLDTHQPFHWFLEFYQIVALRGGFSVIVGNPPYVEYSKIKSTYTLHGYETITCGNIYSQVIERSTKLLSDTGNCGMIVPSASISTPRMNSLIKYQARNYSNLWISCWDERPGKLFNEVDQQLAIHLLIKNSPLKSFSTTNMIHWNRYERDSIFKRVRYLDSNIENTTAETNPRFNNSLELQLMGKISKTKSTYLPFLQVGGDQTELFYRNAGGRYWKLIKSFPAYYRKKGIVSISSTEKLMSIRADLLPIIIAIYSSNAFYWFWRSVSNCRHLTNRELNAFPLAKTLFDSEKLSALGTEYEGSLKKNSIRKTINKAEQDVFYAQKSKTIIDKIDSELALHYGLSERELDFIINYDIKYRMGSAL